MNKLQKRISIFVSLKLLEIFGLGLFSVGLYFYGKLMNSLFETGIESKMGLWLFGLSLLVPTLIVIVMIVMIIVLWINANWEWAGDILNKKR